MMKILVTSAIELTAAQMSKIQKAVTKKYGSEAKISTVVNPKLIGGLTITVGSRQFDGSLRSKIDQIKKMLGEGTIS